MPCLEISPSDLNKPGLAMIPESDRAAFITRCAENKNRYEASMSDYDRNIEYQHGVYDEDGDPGDEDQEEPEAE